MYVFFRLIKAYVFSLFAPSVEPLDTIITRLRVWPNDLDQNLHVNNGRYLTLMDIGRFDLTFRSKLLKVLLNQRIYPVVASAGIRFRRSLRPFQKFELHTRITHWDSKWFYLEQSFLARGETYATGFIKAVFLQDGKPVRPIDMWKHMEVDNAVAPACDLVAPFEVFEDKLRQR